MGQLRTKSGLPECATISTTRPSMPDNCSFCCHSFGNNGSSDQNMHPHAAGTGVRELNCHCTYIYCLRLFLVLPYQLASSLSYFIRPPHYPRVPPYVSYNLHTSRKLCYASHYVCKSWQCAAAHYVRSWCIAGIAMHRDAVWCSSRPRNLS